MIDAIIKKVSLAKGVVKEDVESMFFDLFKQVKEVMGRKDLEVIKIKNLLSFIPDDRKMRQKRKMCDVMIEKGISTERVLELKEIIDNNINKQFKQKRCKTD